MPEMPNKTTQSQTDAIKQTCEKFQIENHQFVALVCDNENVNSGIHGGTCVLVET